MTNVRVPVEIQGFLSWAETKGMRLTSERSDSANCLLHFADDQGLALQVLCDRGQWFVAVGRTVWNDWFDVDVWSSCLDQTPIGFDATDLSDQLRDLKAHWNEIAQAKDALRGCLEKNRKHRAYTRLGFPE